MKIFEFYIDHAGEEGAGISSYEETVFISVSSGDPGGDETGGDSFQEFMRQALAEWFDGADVVLKTTKNPW